MVIGSIRLITTDRRVPEIRWRDSALSIETGLDEKPYGRAAGWVPERIPEVVDATHKLIVHHNCDQRLGAGHDV